MPVEVKRSRSWKCNECGNTLKADNPPDVCPVCESLDAYYEIPEEFFEEPSEIEDYAEEEGEIEED